ncbi:NAD(P)-binding protein [Trichoderma sp. SZMC 28015]
MGSIGKLILVTGANGFIAAHTIIALLDGGYRVRGTVRSKASAETVRKTYSAYSDRFSAVVVPDMSVKNAFDEAVRGIDGALHIASPFTFNIKDNEADLLIPAIEGTKNLLKSVATHAPQAKRVVVTSSSAAMVDFSKGLWPGHAYNEADWNEITYDYAKTADAPVAYCTSKALAEKAAWKFVDEEKPHFDLTVLCPPMVFGPTAHTLSLSTMNTSSWDIYRFLSGELDDVPDTACWAFVDVRDLADAHVRALEIPEAGNERFFIVSERYSYQKTADVLHASPRIAKDDKKLIPVGKPGQNYPSPEVYEVDNSKSKRILGLKYRSFEESIVDAAVNMIQIRNNAI